MTAPTASPNAGAPAAPAARWLRTLAAVVRRVIGAPDYDRYVAHVRQHHPGTEPMTCEEFARERLESRYSRPGARCC